MDFDYFREKIRQEVNRDNYKQYDRDFEQSLKKIIKHDQVINTIAFSNDDKYIATGSNEGQVIIWYNSIYSIHKQFDEHTKSVNFVQFSPCSKKLGSVSNDHMINIWDVNLGEHVVQLSNHQKQISDFSFSFENALMGSVSIDGKIVIWNTENFEALQEIVVPQKNFSSIIMYPNDNLTAVGSRDGVISLYQTQNGQKFRDLKKQKSGITSLTISRDETILASSHQDGSIVLHFIQEDYLFKKIQLHNQRINQIRFSIDCNRIGTASQDNRVIIYDIEQEQIQKDFKHNDDVLAIDFNSQNNQIITSCLNQNTYIWNLEPIHFVKQLFTKEKGVSCIQFAPNGKQIAMSLFDGKIKIVDIDQESFQKTLSIKQLDALVLHLAFTSDGNQLAMALEDGKVIIWDLNKDELCNEFNDHTKAVNSVSFSHDDRFFCSGSSDNSLIIYDFETGSIIQQIQQQKSFIIVCFSPDSKILVSVSKNDVIDYYDTNNGQFKKIDSALKQDITSFTFSPDNINIAMGFKNGKTVIQKFSNIQYEPNEIENEFVFERHNQTVNSITFSPNGQIFGSASQDGCAFLWNAVNGKYLGQFKKRKFKINEIAFCPDGQRLALASHTKAAVICNLCDFDIQSFQYFFNQVDQTETQKNSQFKEQFQQLQKFKKRGIFDLNLIQFIVLTGNQADIKKVLDMIIVGDLNLHICNFYYFDEIFEGINMMNSENKRSFLKYLTIFNQQRSQQKYDVCYKCIELQDRIIQSFSQQKYDIQEILDSLMIKENFNHEESISHSAQIYIKVSKQNQKLEAIQKLQEKLNLKTQSQEQHSILKHGNYRVQSKETKQEQFDRDRQIKQNCYFYFVGIETEYQLIRTIQTNFKQPSDNIYKSIALYHLVNQQYEEYGYQEYKAQAILSILNLILFAINLMYIQSTKVLKNYTNLNNDTIIISFVFNFAALILCLNEIRREIYQINLSIQIDSSYLPGLWVIISFFGIICQIGNSIFDTYMTYISFSLEFKFINSSLAIVGISLQCLSNIKYFRISNKFSSLIQLCQKVIIDMKYFSMLLAFITMDFFFMFYLLQLYGFQVGPFSRFNVFRMTFLILLGEFDDFLLLKMDDQNTESYMSYLIFFVFSVAAFLLQIILMNLLISVIGETYDKAQNQIFQDSLFERVQIMNRINIQFGKQDSVDYLMLVNTQDELTIAEIDDQGETMRKTLGNIQDNIDENSQKLNIGNDNLQKQLNYISYRLDGKIQNKFQGGQQIFDQKDAPSDIMISMQKSTKNINSDQSRNTTQRNRQDSVNFEDENKNQKKVTFPPSLDLKNIVNNQDQYSARQEGHINEKKINQISENLQDLDQKQDDLLNKVQKLLKNQNNNDQNNKKNNRNEDDKNIQALQQKIEEINDQNQEKYEDLNRKIDMNQKLVLRMIKCLIYLIIESQDEIMNKMKEISQNQSQVQ